MQQRKWQLLSWHLKNSLPDHATVEDVWSEPSTCLAIISIARKRHVHILYTHFCPTVYFACTTCTWNGSRLMYSLNCRWMSRKRMLSITLEDYHSLSLKYTRMLLTEFTGCSSYIMYLHEVPVLDTTEHFALYVMFNCDNWIVDERFSWFEQEFWSYTFMEVGKLVDRIVSKAFIS